MAHKHNVFTTRQMKQLQALGQKISVSLACDATTTGPCRTDRLAAVRGMTEYLRIHGFRVEQLIPSRPKARAATPSKAARTARRGAARASSAR